VAFSPHSQRPAFGDGRHVDPLVDAGKADENVLPVPACLPSADSGAETAAAALAPNGNASQQRQRTAQLDHWLSGAPIAQPSLSIWRQALRWCVGHPSVALLLALTVVLLVGGAVAATNAWVHASVALRIAHSQCEATVEQRDAAQAESKQRVAEALREQQLAETEKRTRLSIEGALRESQRARQDAERELADALQRQTDAAKEVRLMIAQNLDEEAARQLGTRPLDALLLAAVSARATLREAHTPSVGLQATLRDAFSKVGAPRVSVPSDGLQSMVVSPDGRWLATGSSTKTVRLWDTVSPDPNAAPWDLQGCRDDVWAMAFDSHGRWLAAATSGRQVYVWNLGGPTPLAPPLVLKSTLSRVTSMVVSPNGRSLALCGKKDLTEQCYILLWDLTLANRAPAPRELCGHEALILASKFSPDGRWLITAGEDKTACLWDIKAISQSCTPIVLCGHQNWVDSLEVTHSGRWLVTGSSDGTARLWRLDASDPAATSIVLSSRPSSWITSMAISADDHWLATGHFDNTVQLWDLTAADVGARVTVLAGHNDHIRAVAFTPNSQALITASQDQTIRLWNLAQRDPAPRTTLLGKQEGRVDFLVVTADGRWLVTASDCSGGNHTAAIYLWALEMNDLVEVAYQVAARRLPLPQRTRILQEAATHSTPLR
jgi:WD40 repeat protein